ncbi:50S ribosomal protein L20 [bacterium (Candidatus Gribaldobacteria) CG07_land_8_20_14_0_80_33_18]|uniref:Large ribosomal subunit protein bL20 n=1 Tax=bacterium (Candidatus Gribaldobacteria) CG07_land_8_20_14_0_80_33_18 TaxID=2014272 RepID=A0A2M6Z3W6_9BACT|nr:MAG: 50S ribosomal protein L20 [bacterium (Candidatus Gribaldobacteria) CG07_land_8_20_14_0_80_33_18]PJA00367.1 MAG: 50S ribosomal protein L20 [bacterium (Candidatus Gribaldobacteria) CG_4_10_14_0_2_um_filter_33_15]PJB08963.1 MAG: 50S ribosomal protein L20 [bacterium (Candidatus Gribaldobacteria) CG_4_9_14_3_um_filter_33_9]
MTRVKRGKIAHKRRKHLLKYTKGFRWGRKSKYRAAKEALLHAFTYAYRDRKAKKRERRALWQIQINAACREHSLSYSKFIHGLKQKKIELDRKILAQLAQSHPEIFEKLVEKAKTSLKNAEKT